MESDRELVELQDLGDRIVEKARAAGADVAEAVVRQGSELSARVRLGEVEMLREAGSRAASLRVMRQQRVATTATSDLSDAGLALMVGDALALVDLSERDPYAGPADPELLAGGPYEDLQLYDQRVESIDGDQAIQMAMEGERAAREHDPRISNMQHTTFTRAIGGRAIVLSSGFRSTRRSSAVALGVVAVADDADHKKRRGSWHEARRYYEDLPAPQVIGRRAAERTVQMLGARKDLHL